MAESTTITKEKIAEKLKSQLGLSSLMCEEVTLQLFTSILDLTKGNSKSKINSLAAWTRPGKIPRVARLSWMPPNGIRWKHRMPMFTWIFLPIIIPSTNAMVFFTGTRIKERSFEAPHLSWSKSKIQLV